MASKRKRDGAEQSASTPASKITKTEEVTRSGRVRKKPAKFADSDNDDEEEQVAVSPKPVSVPPVMPKPQVQVAMPTKSPVKAEPTNIQAVATALLQAQTAPMPKIVQLPVTPMQAEVKYEPGIESPESADDVSKAAGRTGRMRKKSAKVLEMEEFEEAERKTLNKKPGTAEAPKKSSPEITAIPQEALPPKKAYKATTNVPPLVTAALAAKIASSTPPVALKIKDMPVSPKAQVKTEVMSPVKIKTEVTPPSKTKPAKAVANTIRLDQASKQDKGSVIKLLLSSPTQSSNPVLSTKSVAGTSPPAEKSVIPAKKKIKREKEKASTSTAVVDTSPTDLPNLKLALSSPSNTTLVTKLQADPNITSIKQELPVSPEGHQALKLKFVLNPDSAPTLKTSPSKTEPLSPTLNKTEPLSPVPVKSTPKSKKGKKGGAKDTMEEQEPKLSPNQTVPPSVIHVPSTSGFDTSDQHLPPKKKKSAKIKIEKAENLELEKNIMDNEFDIDLSTLGDAGEESLMDIDEDDGLMISEEEFGPMKPIKSVKKKKVKSKVTSKKGPIQLGDVPANTDSELVMDFERMKQDDKKKKKQQKAAVAEAEQTKKKRAPTAYMLWCSANRQRVVKDNPGIDFSTISKTLGELWSGLPDKDKMMWKRKAKKAAGKGSTLIQTGKAAALVAKQQAQAQAQAQPVPIRHGGHHPGSQKASAAVTAAMLTKAAKQAMEEAPVKGFGADPVDVAAHLKIVGESLSIIGMRLQEHRGLIAVQGSLSVLLDSMLCAMAPLMCLTNQLEELNGCSHQTHMKTLDNIAYIMPGL